MKLALLVYLASILPKFSELLFLIGAIVSAISLFSLLYNLLEMVRVSKIHLKALKISMPIALLCLFFSSLIPSEKTIYIMAGAYATEQIATSDKVQKIGSDVLEVIEKKLDKLKNEK